MTSTCFGENVLILNKARAHPPRSTEEQAGSALVVAEQRGVHSARLPIKCEMPIRSLCRIPERQGHLEADILNHLTVLRKQKKTRKDESRLSSLYFPDRQVALGQRWICIFKSHTWWLRNRNAKTGTEIICEDICL